MPVKRDESGNIIEQPTEQGDAASQDAGYQPGTPGGQSVENTAVASDSPFEQPTQVTRGADSKSAKSSKLSGIKTSAGTGATGASADARTKVMRGGKGNVKAGNVSAGAQTVAPVEHADEDDAMADPPVGWLVVVRGPGRGQVVALGHGRNSIGSDANERCVIDFGDQTISRNGHAVVSYDVRGKRFYIQGGGTNLAYINETPILEAQELAPHAEIQLGETTLRFVPLCGENFNWE